jgi:hypothetical protein
MSASLTMEAPVTPKKESSEDRERDYQKKYYEENRDRIQEHRRKKYTQDDDYREKARLRSKRQYWFKTRQEVQKKRTWVELPHIDPAGEIEFVVDNPLDARHGETVSVRVYTTAAVAQLFGRSAQTIRLWERDGVLPEPAHRGRDFDHWIAPGRNPRLYTQDEMEVFQECRELIDVPAPSLKESVFSQCMWEKFGEMNAGLVVIPAVREYRKKAKRK